MKSFKILLLFACILTASYSKDGVVSIDEISKEAKEEKKHIMVFFHMEYCPYCIRLMNNAFNDKKAKKKMENDYIFVDVNIDDKDIISYKKFKGTKKEFSKDLAIGYYPTIVFIDKNNEIVYAMKGYRKTNTFNHILDYITKKEYLKTDFAGYLFDNDID